MLYNCIYTLRPHNAAVGFRVNRSVRTGAERHLGNKVLLTMDISNYFNSIKQPMIYRIICLCVARTFPQLKGDEESVSAANLLADLCCYKNQLPQGAPTSPALANLFAMSFDRTFTQLAKQCGMTYT